MFELCDIVRETGYAIHTFLRNGLRENVVYENALMYRLQNQGIPPSSNIGRRSRGSGRRRDDPLGEFFADLFIENILIVELKAVRAVVDEHTAQLLGYLRCSRMEHGLLMNFGAPRFFIKKVHPE